MCLSCTKIQSLELTNLLPCVWVRLLCFFGFFVAGYKDLGCAQIHGYLQGNPVKALVEEAGVSVHIVVGAEVVLLGEAGTLYTPPLST